MTKPRRTDFRIKPQTRRFDYPLLLIVLALTIFGVIMVYDASVAEAYRDFSDKFYFARLQAQWAALGLVAMLVASRLPLSWIKRAALPFFVITLVLLTIVLIPGIGQKIHGARRWIELAGFTLQPAELAKLSFVLYLSTWLEKGSKTGQFLIISALLLGLLMAQPDLGTSIVILATGAALYFFSGAPILYLIGIGLAGVAGGIGLILSSSYRRERLLTFLNPQTDPLGISYHIRQILLALGSGGLLGVGIGRSRQKYAYLPEATTDSIFAVIGEEVGFVGAVAVIGLFLALIYRGFRQARLAPDRFTQLLAGGITAWLGLQTLLNLSAMVALVPLTGIPLPFVSYGGSSLVTALTGVGLLLNISRQKT